MRRGEVRWVDLEPATGGEIGATRPCVVVSNNAANRHSNRVQVIPVTSNVREVHRWEALIELKGAKRKALADQIRTVAKERVTALIAAVTDDELRRIEEVLRFQLGLR